MSDKFFTKKIYGLMDEIGYNFGYDVGGKEMALAVVALGLGGVRVEFDKEEQLKIYKEMRDKFFPEQSYEIVNDETE